MSYTMEDLKKKLFEMYPEIKKHDISMGLDFSEAKNAYVYISAFKLPSL